MISASRFVSTLVAWIGFVLTTCPSEHLVAQCSNPWPPVLGSAGVEGEVSDLLPYDPDGPGPIGMRLLVSGRFEVAGSVTAQNLALYDPASRTWTAFGPGPYPAHLHLAQDVQGDLYVGGMFDGIGTVTAANVARFDGTNWHALGSGVVSSSQYFAVRHLAPVPGGGIVVTGPITAAGGLPANGIARWDGNAWSSIGANALAGTVVFGPAVAMPNGDIVASLDQGSSTFMFSGLQRFDGTNWSVIANMGWRPDDMLVMPNGDLCTAGWYGIMTWNGTTWQNLLTTVGTFVSNLALMPNGLLIATRSSVSQRLNVSAWDGTTWVTFGTSSMSSTDLGATAVIGNEVFVGGGFQSMDGVSVGHVARWGSLGWTPTNPGLVGSIRWLAVRPDGSLFAAAAFGGVGDSLVHRWTGLGWTPIGGAFQSGPTASSSLTALYATPSGRLLAAGPSSASTTARPVLREWTTGSWTNLAQSTGSIRAIVELPNGDIVVGGHFAEIGGTAATNVARFNGTTWSPVGVDGLGETVTALTTMPNGDPIAISGKSVVRWTGTAWIRLGPSFAAPPNALIVGADGAPVVAGDFIGSDVLRWTGVDWQRLGTGPAGPVQSLLVLGDGDIVAGPVVAAGSTRTLERWNGVSWSPLGGTVDATVWTLAFALNGDLLLGGDFALANGAVRARFARVSTTCPATAIAIMAGCSGTRQLEARELPWIGGTCRTIATGLNTEQLAVTVTGTQSTHLLLGPLLAAYGGGCALIVMPLALDPAVPTAGTVAAQFSVPDAPALVGTVLRQQVVGLSFSSSGSLFLVDATNALLLQVGSF